MEHRANPKTGSEEEALEKTVICMKWGPAYAPDYVNVLASAVKQHLKEPHRFVCITDDAEGISPDVETYPIPDMGLAQSAYKFGAWPKISLFKPDLYGLKGRALFIDLDSMICDDLAPMFDHPGSLLMIKEWRRPIDNLRVNRPVRGASGVLAFDFDELTHIYDELIARPDEWPNEIRNDQRFIWKIHQDVSFWPDEWVISFKRHLLRAPLVNRVLPPKSPPEGTKILAFHGRPRPAEIVPDSGQRWGDFWRSGKGAVPWFREYWMNNGGREDVEGIGPMRDWRGRPKD
ncbi:MULTISPECIES: hypothetical protein [Rhodobacterales]|uniref:Glycosyltransferase n=1 Tax=Halocynthiibacter styelae TaxID=2761955 RepID=A0A8J7IW62_9RHOB|nr:MULTISPECIES: hypothetical protein [Rhodobacterales]MBI1493863.1 hypothetical protein [Paenihalocynthiibacter styelae]